MYFICPSQKKSQYFNLVYNTFLYRFGQSIGSVLLVAEIAWPSKWVILIGSLLSTIGAGMQSLTG